MIGKRWHALDTDWGAEGIPFWAPRPTNFERTKTERTILGMTHLRGPKILHAEILRVFCFAARATIYRRLFPKESRKEPFFGGLQKSPRKYPQKSKNTRKIPNLDFSGIFRHFWGLFCRPPPQKDSFRDFFGISGPETPVNGRLGRKFYSRLGETSR